MSIADSLVSALDRLILFIPRLVSAIVILAVGLLLAWLLAGLARRLLHVVGFDRFLARHEIAPRGAQPAWASSVAGRIVYWVVALVAFVAAADALQLQWVSLGLARVIGYLPNLLAATLILLAGWVAGRLALRALSRSPHWARLARGALLVVAGFMAIQELQVATVIVTILFAFLVGAAAVAAAISFGIGNRHLAGEITRDWWERNGAPLRDTSSSSGIVVPPLETPEPIVRETLPEDSDEEPTTHH